MARFKNVGGDVVSLYYPAGHPGALRVEADQIVEVPGSVSAETDDAYIVGEGDGARAFGKAQWQATSKSTHGAGSADEAKE